MFDKYGEFDSFTEINAKADELLKAGDTEGVKALAEENGISSFDADDYMEGLAGELCSALMAANGKLEIEKKDLGDNLQKQEIFNDWIQYIFDRIAEDEDLQLSVRRKGKTLIGCIANIMKWSYNNAYEIDKRIIEAFGSKTNMKVKLGIPGSGTVKRLINEYYIGKKAV